MTTTPPFVTQLDETDMQTSAYLKVWGNPQSTQIGTLAPETDNSRFLGLGTAGQLLGVNAAGNDLSWNDPAGFDWNAYAESPESQDVLQGNDWPAEVLGIGTDGTTLYRHTKQNRNFAGYNSFVKKSVAAVADPDSETTDNFQVSTTNGQRLELMGIGTTATDTSFANFGQNPLLAGTPPQRTLTLDGAQGTYIAEDNVRVLFNFATTLNVQVDKDWMAANTGYTYGMYIGTEAVATAERDAGRGSNPVIGMIMSAKIDRSANGLGASEIRGIQIPLFNTPVLWHIGVDLTLQCSFLLDLKAGDTVNGRIHWASGNAAAGFRHILTASRATAARTFANEMPQYRVEYV